MRRAPKQRVATGLDVLLADASRIAKLRGARVGVLANPTSVTRTFEHVVDAFVGEGIRPTRLFGPEHGVRGEAQDMIAVDQQVDPISGIETISLYGHDVGSLRPPQGSLDDLDVLVVDLQDIGSRYYTYVYTAMFAAEAATRAGVDVWVLDRPNPIGGAIEGPPVRDGFGSFVGELPLPNRHGLTLAEVLRFALRAGHELRFDTIEVEGWTRDVWFDEHDAPWVLPSPNMPTLDTAVVYPGQCLLEGTNLSEGRGTTRPFELFGAPFVDAMRWKHAFDALALPGVIARTISFEPTFQKWARTRCSGLQLHVTDRRVFRPLATSAALVHTCASLFGDAFDWRRDAYEFVDDVPAIDLLFGDAWHRELIESGGTVESLFDALRTPDETMDAVLAARSPTYEPGAA